MCSMHAMFFPLLLPVRSPPSIIFTYLSECLSTETMLCWVAGDFRVQYKKSDHWEKLGTRLGPVLSYIH